MSDTFATAMRQAMGRAMEKTRGADPGAATAIIQAALSGRPAPSAQDEECGPCAAAAAARSKEAMPSMGGGLPGMKDFQGLPGLDALKGMKGMPSMKGMSSMPGGMAQTRRAPVPEGATVEMRHHTSPAGGRDVRLFVPSPREGGYSGLVIMLHGCTQSPEDFALGTRMDIAAEEAGFIVAYPGQTGAHNMQSCWNWFRPEDQRRGGGEPELLASLATRLAEEFEVTGRVHVAGLSAGGAMAAVLADTHPEIVASVGIHSGLPAGSASDMPSAFAAMRGQGGAGRVPKRPAIVFHGTADGTVSDRNAHHLVPGNGTETSHQGNSRSWTRLTTAEGSELWLVAGAGHAWFGGDGAGSYADPLGPDASAEMLRFFAAHHASETRDG